MAEVSGWDFLIITRFIIIVTETITDTILIMEVIITGVMIHFTMVTGTRLLYSTLTLATDGTTIIMAGMVMTITLTVTTGTMITDPGPMHILTGVSIQTDIHLRVTRRGGIQATIPNLLHIIIIYPEEKAPRAPIQGMKLILAGR